MMAYSNLAVSYQSVGLQYVSSVSGNTAYLIRYGKLRILTFFNTVFTAYDNIIISSLPNDKPIVMTDGAINSWNNNLNSGRFYITDNGNVCIYTKTADSTASFNGVLIWCIR